MRFHEYKSDNVRTKVEKINGTWKVFLVSDFLGKTFKTLISQGKTKTEALKYLER